MRALPLAAAVLASLTATACDSYRQQATVTRPIPVDANRPVPGATMADHGTAMNSDNQPIPTRTGLNSDPNRPDGQPRPLTRSHYEDR